MIVEKMQELGFNQEQINIILTNYAIEKMRKKKLKKLVNEMLEYLKEFGYTDEDIVKISKLHPQIYGYSIKNIKQKILFLQKLGYNNLKIIKITKNSPQIFSITCENILDKIDTMEKLGYKTNDILHTIYRFPQLLTLSIEYIISKFNDLIELGYTHEEVIKITIKFPQIWSLTMENISKKKEFYDMIGISNFILAKANLLMQSIELSYARYMFYNSIGKTIDSDNYIALFYSQNGFKKKYNITNEELIEQYPYNREEFIKRIKK